MELPKLDAKDDVSKNGVVINSQIHDQANPEVSDTKGIVHKKNPFFYSRWLANKTYVVFAVTFVLHCSMVALSGILYVTGYPILEMELSGVPLHLRGSEKWNKQRSFSALRRGNVYKFKPKLSNISNEERFLLEYEGNFRFYFADFVIEMDGNNLLTKDNLKKIQSLENHIINDSNYRCNSKNCLPYSIIRFFDGTFGDVKDPDFDDIPGVLNKAMNHTETRYILDPLLSKISTINNRSAESDLTYISFYTARYPQKDTDRLKYWTKNFEKLHEEGYEGLTVYVMSTGYYIENTLKKVSRDMILIIGSFTFIVLFMWFQTNSLWLSLWGIVSTLFSFVVANLLYTIVFGFRYFGIFHVLGIFIILGISADDIFIFCDTWKATSYQEYPTLAHRISDCYNRAAKSMFVTSITTAAAFFASAFSSNLSISSFGMYSGLVVLTNYLSVIIFYPSIVVIYHFRFENMCSKTCKSDETLNNPKKPRLMIRFFTGPYYKMIKNRVFQCLCLLIFAGFVSTSAYFVSVMKVDTREPKYVRSGEKTEQHLLKRFYDFKAHKPNSNANIYIVWGLETQAVEKCGSNEYTVKCFLDRKTNLNQKFDLNPHPAQKDLLDFCRYLQGLDEQKKDKLNIRIHPITGKREIYCFMKSVEDFVEDDANMSFPMSKNKVMSVYKNSRKHLPTWYTLSGNNTGSRFMEELYSMWTINDSIDKRNFGEQVGLQNSNGKMFEKRFAFVAVKVALTINQFVFNYVDGLALHDTWDNLVKEKVSKMSPTMNQGFQLTPSAWAWFERIQAYTKQGVLTLGVGVGVAWVILVIFCRNWIIGTLATVCIACTGVSAMGVISMIGWKYGIIESINTTLVIGLAIDYVVHFGVAYTGSPFEDRANRVKYALGEMGLPVISGAATTLGSSFFMLFTKIQFFYQFGIFMFSTIGFSIVYAMSVFLVVLLLAGPQGSTGSNKVIFDAIRRTCSRCKGVNRTVNISA